LLTRLADAGEDAISKLGDTRGMDRMVGFANSTRDRLDELTKRVSGMDALERRITKLEKRLDEMSGTKSPSARTPAKKTKPRETGARSSSSSSSSSAKAGGDSPG
jgi:hypothetical protein